MSSTDEAHVNDLTKSKAEALASLEALAELATRAGAETLATSLKHDRIRRLRDEQLYLVVIGEFNHGKSTLINALLGAEALPVGVTPTTAHVHRVAYGDAPRATLVLRSGEERSIAFDELRSLTVGGLENSEPRRETDGGPDEIAHVAVTYSSPFLRGGIVLIDTPGVNDLSEARSEVTYGYLSSADAILFVLDASQILKESERRFLEERLLREARRRVFFVVNKIDALDEQEQDEALSYARAHLTRYVESPRIWALSAEQATRGDETARQAVEAFAGDVLGHLRSERGGLLVATALDAGLRVAERLRAGIEIQRRAIAMERTELERRLAALERDFNASIERRASREKSIVEAIGGLKAVVRHDIEGFSKRFAATIAQEIDDSDPKDLRKYLASFIEAKFRELADEQVESVARRLEQIAEEAVSFVAEDAEQRRRSLSEALGSETASELDLRVDTFAYDVGVFAVGAFGVTLMVLSNVVLGGAMALAAPVLAYALRGRADQRVKDHALREAPRVIVDVGARLAEGFDERIDEVGQRLIEFMRQIDDEMSRSVAELVRAARAAQEDGTLAQQGLLSTADATLESLARVAASMSEQRARIDVDDELA